MANIFDLFRSIEQGRTGADGTGAFPISHLLVGLGNPGKQYEGTRHNVGFDAVMAVASECKVKMNVSRFHALVGDGMLGGKRTLFMMPQTFMNASGIAVAEAASFYKIPPKNILVLCDDISFDVGRMRLRQKGSAGGHNGLKSIIEKLGSDEFSRLKIGVGQKPHADYDLADWVLGHFAESDKDILRLRVPSIIQSVTLAIQGNYDEAMRVLSLENSKEGRAT